MRLGDFFANAPFARPVNAKPILFTANTKRPIMPGGQRNPTGHGDVSAVCRAAFIFMNGQDASDARLAARDYMEARRKGDDGTSKPYDGLDMAHETTYQHMWRVLFEWDEKEERVGAARLFETVDLLRECVIPEEANRVMKLYDEYVKSEHPEGLDPATFLGTGGGGKGAPAPKPGR